MRRLLERNTILKNWTKVDLRICLYYPSTYESGILSLALQMLYGLFNEREDVLCERSFDNIYPRGISIESHRKLNKFDVLAFTIHNELDLSKCVEVLELLGIPVYSKDRNPREYPILIAGGPVAFQNPSPISPIFDAIFIGEVEDVYNQLLDALKVAKDTGSLEALAEVPGLYVPIHSEKRVRRVYTKDLDESFYPLRQFIPVDIKVAFGPSFLLEINRGCGYGCRFCLAGFIYRPPRMRSMKRILEILDIGLKQSGVNSVSLISLAMVDHPQIVDILEEICDRNLRVSIPSLRLDALSEDVIKLIRKSGQRSITVAPEVATVNLANSINKGIYPDDLFELCRIARSYGFRKIKLYFMIGFPGETLKDVMEIGRLIRKIKESGFQRVTVTINPFIPKPHTPLQWAPFESIKNILEKEDVILRSLKSTSGVKVEFLNWKFAYSETFLARAPEEAHSVILEVAHRGVRTVSSWHRAISKYIGKYGRILEKPLQGYELEDELPWDIVDIGISKSYLRYEYEKYFSGEITESCYSRCSNCGICPLGKSFP
ncbi:MAG: hypothetical protein DRJ49_02465 [Thermoprotei archaeon]|nr:MAG: hypothetical protein DRJ49_02465 [Thermoprotei archaeon]